MNSGYFELVSTIGNEAELNRLMDTNRIRAALVIPAGFARDLDSGLTVPVQILLNGDNANTATTVMGYATSIVQTESGRRIAASTGTNGPPIRVEPRIWHKPAAAQHALPRSRADRLPRDDHGGDLDGALGRPRKGARHDRTDPDGAARHLLVHRRQDGAVLRHLAHLGAAHRAGGHGALRFADARIVGAAHIRAFAVPRGALGLGLFISTIADSQQVAFQVAVLASFLPTLMLSGFIFPIASMPVALQAITYVVPARYFLIALRGIVLKGVGVETIGSISWRS